MKPKYHFLANAKFALEGVLAMLKQEVAFRIELAIIIPAVIISFFLPLDLIEHKRDMNLLFWGDKIRQPVQINPILSQTLSVVR